MQRPQKQEMQPQIEGSVIPVYRISALHFFLLLCELLTSPVLRQPHFRLLLQRLMFVRHLRNHPRSDHIVQRTSVMKYSCQLHYLLLVVCRFFPLWLLIVQPLQLTIQVPIGDYPCNLL